MSEAEVAAEEQRALFRAVSEAELEDIDAFRGFRPHPNGKSLEVKLFSASASDAAAFGRDNFDLDGKPFFLVEAIVPKSIYDQLEHLLLDGKAALVLQRGRQASFNATLRSITVLTAIPLTSERYERL